MKTTRYIYNNILTANIWTTRNTLDSHYLIHREEGLAQI